MTLIVKLSTLKAALGIDAGDTSGDSALTADEARAAEWVEGQTHRRFQEPDERVEVLEGSGFRTLYLTGHIDDPDASITVRERMIGAPASEWKTLTSGTDYERRRDSLIRTDGYAWSTAREYEITYDDGYDEAPQDIQALVIELVGLTQSSASGESGLKSETIGEYSYTLESAAAVASLSITSAAVGTLNRWKRGRV